MADYFISYSKRDRNFAQQLYNALESNGFDAWIDHIDLPGGSRWRAQITKAIRECRAVILVIPPHSMASENVSREMNIADEEGKKIIPIVYERARLSDDIEFILGNVQRIDFQRSFQDGFGRLIRALPAGRRPRRQLSLVGSWQVDIVFRDNDIRGRTIFDFYKDGTFEARTWNDAMPGNQSRHVRGRWAFKSNPPVLSYHGIENQMGRNWGTDVFLDNIEEDYFTGSSDVYAQSEWTRIG